MNLNWYLVKFVIHFVELKDKVSKNYTHLGIALVGTLFAVMLYIFLPYDVFSATKNYAMFFFGGDNGDGVTEYTEAFPNSLPKVEEKEVQAVYYVSATAYNSEPGQTDDTPCITANGYNVCEKSEENVIATNFLPFGTRVRFPDLYGDKVFYVMDRMNPRYTHRVDFWMIEKVHARTFGIKHNIKMEIL